MNKKEAIIAVLSGKKVTFMTESSKNGKKDHAYYKNNKVHWKFDDDSESVTNINDWEEDEYFIYNEPIDELTKIKRENLRLKEMVRSICFSQLCENDFCCECKETGDYKGRCGCIREVDNL